MLGSILPLVKNPDPRLRKKSDLIPQKDIAPLHSFARNMMKAMKKYGGVGLAAPQVGKNIRLFVANWGDENRVFINPVLTKRSTVSVTDEEGCLSIPGVYGNVARPRDVTIEALDEQGVAFSLSLTDLAARVVQHEIDHLDGILIIDKFLRA